MSYSVLCEKTGYSFVVSLKPTRKWAEKTVVFICWQVFFLTPKSELLEGKDLLLEEHVTLPVDHVVCHLFDTLQEGDENGSQVGSSAYLEQVRTWLMHCCTYSHAT